MRFTVTTMAPHDFKRYQQTHEASYAYFQTAVGILKMTIYENKITHAQFCDEQMASGSFLSDDKLMHFLLVGTPFQLKVWRALLEIPSKKTCSYETLAHAIDHPRSWRAVANAVGQNPIAYFVPCHRVIRKNGELGGYRWGISVKEKLLRNENSFHVSASIAK